MPHVQNANLGASILQNVRSAVSSECFRVWFKDLKVIGVEGSSLRMVASNRYIKQWIESHYRKELLKAVTTLMPEIKQVEVTVTASTRSVVNSSQPLAQALDNALPAALRSSTMDCAATPRHLLTTRGDLFPPLIFNYRLENFIVGKCNRIAYAAAQTIAETPATVYNPLFLHGAQGLGKTHLLQGIGQLLQDRPVHINFAYISCEEFTNQYVMAVQSKQLDAFRARYRSCGALLLDDVQFLSGREKTQEEFLHTFDALCHAHKQVVLCANCSPRDIKRLDSRLVTRFQSGLVARLDSPDAEMRMAVLRAKAKMRGLQLAAEVAEVLAAHIHTNIRELEGVVCKLMALSAAEARTPDRELAIVALRELGYLRSGPLLLQDILSAVSQHYSVTTDELRGNRRHASLVRVRHIAMYLSAQLCSQSITEIGRFYGNRDHATILHAVKKITELLKHDTNLKQELQPLRQILGR
ncbi:MAG: chromosomal replication initiator protein DnaA [Planctomycetota bacterium]